MHYFQMVLKFSFLFRLVACCVLGDSCSQADKCSEAEMEQHAANTVAERRDADTVNFDFNFSL